LVTIHHVKTLYQVVLVLLPPHKFMYLPCYYWLQEIKTYNGEVVYSGINSYQILWKLVNWFKSWKGHTHRWYCDFI